MSRTMLINVTQAEESRVAIVEDGLLEWIEIETGSREKLKGNIYKGVVENVNSSLQAAFVGFANGRTGFLPLDEVNFRTFPPRRRAASGRPGTGKPRISDVLKVGQEMLVQVTREQFARKPPSLSTFFSFPGRFLVLLPGSDSSGISRKIEDEAGRERLKKIIKELAVPEGVGVIVRTAGLDQTKTALARDMRYLSRLWGQIEKAAAKAKAPSLIYRERDLVLRAIRDLFTPSIKEVLIDDEETYKRALAYFKSIMPGKQKRVTYYNGDAPLFSKHNLEDQIENIYKRQVPLKSGGAIVIDTTEALTSIDVNSGRTRESTIEETACRANIEAASELARQLRLRDIGGLVVIDFIDMRSRGNIRTVEKTLRDAMRQDKARHDMTRISKLGLLEMSRQRLRATTASSTYQPCKECEGNGVVKTVESAAVALLRRIHARCARSDLARVKVILPAEVASYLLNRKRDELLRVEQRYQTEILIMAQPGMRAGDLQVDVEPRSAVDAKERKAARGEEPRVKHSEMDESRERDEKRRRRGRKRRRNGAGEVERGEEILQGVAPADEAPVAALTDESLDAPAPRNKPAESSTSSKGRRSRGGRSRTTRKKPARSRTARCLPSGCRRSSGVPPGGEPGQGWKECVAGRGGERCREPTNGSEAPPAPRTAGRAWRAGRPGPETGWSACGG
ncbi:MAG: Rne/Rng family ribonuclease, partial [Acidobacteria bacterium]|nr:Rne/Rng family ribonuclease [Acidobacteriota bacterium]